MFFTDRRRFLVGGSAAAAFFTTPGLFAEELSRTQSLTEGPFYPDKMPLDTDNDLLIINDRITPATGVVTHLTGRVLTAAGSPVRNAFVEIWQCCNNGSYIHSKGGDAETRDQNFQGYGRFLTDAQGRYYFRTIRPVPYTMFGVFRTPHIHVAVSTGGQRVMTTQLLIDGHKDNARDRLTNRVPAEQLKTVMTKFESIKGSKIGEQQAKFDVVLGVTAAEDESGAIKGLGKSQLRRRG